ncbi:radical SAM protein [Chryseobacterium lactis]|uniref:radical SAM protein n=1 Tax=Chryseobacterium lactis TaxID=1241981 RepID=UPI0009E38B74|nr:radical SAM protein [Chryseobacterium lactis]
MKGVNRIIVKIASLCNINCTYCYMYNLGDTSYRNQPKFISEATVRSLTEKVINHCKKFDVDKFHIILHGGEPLLMSKTEFVKMIEIFKLIEKENIEVSLSIQTNGILIDNEWCSIFEKYSISVGVSIDGNKKSHDYYRVDKKGKGTFDKVIKGIGVLRENKIPYGCLGVMNLDIDPEEMYMGFLESNIHNLDILIMDANYDSLDSFSKRYSLSEWYIQIFNKLYFEKNKLLEFRLFRIIMDAVLGLDCDIDMLGTSENNVLVIETNGEIEPVDVLKICGENFTKTNINVMSNELEDAFGNTLAEIYYNSGRYLSKKCLACPVNEICGGGYIAHRYSSENGFNNPSVYCDDLLKLITYIQGTIIDDLPAEVIQSTGIQKLTYEKALAIIEENLPTLPDPVYTEKLESFRKIEYGIV